MRYVEIKEQHNIRYSKNKDLANSYCTILKDLGLKCSVEKDVLDGYTLAIAPQTLTIGNQDNVLYSFLVDRYVQMYIQYR